MKIWGDSPKVSGVQKTEKTGNIQASASKASSTKKDTISISKEAMDIQTAKKALEGVPDIRAEKVEPLKEQYDAGTYDVKSQDIVEKIFKSIQEKKA